MLGYRLKSLREDKGLSQLELAKMVNVSTSSIAMYELNAREPNNDLLLKFSDIFNVSVDYLLGKTDIKNEEELKKTIFANEGGIDTQGLTNEEIKELQDQVEFIKWKKDKLKRTK